jgi:hypothetical protein
MTRLWSKLKSRIEAPVYAEIAARDPLQRLRQVWDKGFDFDKPRHWIMLGHGRATC